MAIHCMNTAYLYVCVCLVSVCLFAFPRVCPLHAPVFFYSMFYIAAQIYFIPFCSPWYIWFIHSPVFQIKWPKEIQHSFTHSHEKATVQSQWLFNHVKFCSTLTTFKTHSYLTVYKLQCTYLCVCLCINCVWFGWVCVAARGVFFPCTAFWAHLR